LDLANLPAMTLRERLAAGPVILMDGGTGTEIQRRGGVMDDQVWCGTAHMHSPDLVREVHEAYIRAGAEIVIANTFATARHVLESSGHGDEFEASNRRAVELAIEARERAAERPVWVAGSISSMAPLKSSDVTARGAGVEDGFRAQAEILAQAGADLIVAEMMLDLPSSEMVIRAAASVDIPLWVGLSASVVDGQVVGYRSPRNPEPLVDFASLADALLALGGDVVGVMHTAVADTAPALEVLAQRWDGPTMAYAETGHFEPPDWIFTEAVGPDAYADAVTAWVSEHDVRVVGGCCGTGPDHIRALKERLG
jgi:S-methylmethionine-dependent homocysteine/selenocysteine methylase